MLPNKVGEIKLSRPNSFLLPTQMEDTFLFLVRQEAVISLLQYHHTIHLEIFEKQQAEMSKCSVKLASSNNHHRRVLWWDVQCPMEKNLTNTHMTHVILFTEVLVCPQLSSLSCMCRAARRNAVLHFISTANRSCSTSPTLWEHTHSSSYTKKNNTLTALKKECSIFSR